MLQYSLPVFAIIFSRNLRLQEKYKQICLAEYLLKYGKYYFKKYWRERAVRLWK